MVKESKDINQGQSLRGKGYVRAMFNKFKMELDLSQNGGKQQELPIVPGKSQGDFCLLKIQKSEGGAPS